MKWNSPSEVLKLQNVDNVELFRIKKRVILSEERWPESFWVNTSNKLKLNDIDSTILISLFNLLGVGEPARCHKPLWGVAFYRNECLLYTTTICFECSNCYIYSEKGRQLTAFDSIDIKSERLLEFLRRMLLLK